LERRAAEMEVAAELERRTEMETTAAEMETTG
jgi:hypothetical protein